jgi:hypothetical protein
MGMLASEILLLFYKWHALEHSFHDHLTPFLPTGKDIVMYFVLVVEPDYLPDSEVFVFSRVYTP